MNESEAPIDPWGSEGPFPVRPRARHSAVIFRVIVVAVPVMLGTLFGIWVLFDREILIKDRASGWIRIQSPPIYLEEPDHKVTGHRYLYDARLGWKNIPNWNATSRGRKLTINSQGLRDRERPIEKRHGDTRLLVLGDSFAWGYGVSDDEVFSKVLERRLEDDHENIEVINTGVSGWGTDQEYLYLIDKGFAYAPDIVVLAFFLRNDTINNVHSKQYGLHKPVFLDTDLNLGNTPVPKPSADAPEFTVETQPVEITAAIIKRMWQTCNQRGCRLVVMKFGRFIDPSHEVMKSEERQLREAIQSLTGVEYLDLDEHFIARDVSKRELLHGNVDGHWNEFGHRHVANILYDYLMETGMGPRD